MGIDDDERMKIIENNKEILSIKYQGLGLKVTKENPDDYIMIVSVLEGSSADEKGLEEGDIILEIDYKNTRKMKLEEFVKLAKGNVGTSVKLKVRKKHTGSVKKIRVERKEISFIDEKMFSHEVPKHGVYLDAFYIDKYEVTNEEYAKCVGGGPCGTNNKYDGFTDPRQPVVGVDWTQASTYCSWAGKRLPTEAEWEKAARGTEARTRPWGEGIDCAKANYKDCGHGVTKPVGSYPSGSSPYGAMDMAGNVWEWCADWYDKEYYRNSPNRNPKGPSSGRYRVLRGGSWNDPPTNLRSSLRGWSNLAERHSNYGFRCARTP